jgi:hypothetical protein
MVIPGEEGAPIKGVESRVMCPYMVIPGEE